MCRGTVDCCRSRHAPCTRGIGSISLSQLWQNKEHVIVAGTFELTAGTVLWVRLHHRKNNKQNDYRMTSLLILADGAVFLFISRNKISPVMFRQVRESSFFLFFYLN